MNPPAGYGYPPVGYPPAGYPPSALPHQGTSAIPGGYNPGVHNPSSALEQSGIRLPVVVSSQYCLPHITHFVIEQKVFTVSAGKFVILDGQGQTLFTVEGKLLALHTKRVLRDAGGNAILWLKKKKMTMHDRWEAYRGDIGGNGDLLFTMKKSAVLQMRPHFEVFVASNTAMNKPDFTLKGDFLEHSYTVFHGDIPVAAASKKINLSSIFAGKDQYGVTNYPGVDNAFIASLVVIMDQVQQDDRGS